MTQSNKSGYPTALSTGQWQVVNRLLTVIFPVDSNPPFEQLGPYRACTINHSFPDRYGPAVDRARLSSRRQTMNRGETKKTTWEGPRERSLSALPQPFSCLTSVQLFAQLHDSSGFLLRAGNRLYLPAIHVNVTGYHNQNVIEILFRSLQHRRFCSKIY